MADKPSKGLADVVAASTALSDIDGRAGRLFYRGYDIHELAGRATFEEIAYLLQRGAPPSRGELAGYRDELAAGRALGRAGRGQPPARSPEPRSRWRRCAAWSRWPAPTTRTRTPTSRGQPAQGGPADRAAAAPGRRATRPPAPAARSPDARPGLSIAANFLLQVTGRAPGPRAAEIFDTCLVLHADHTMNASTFAARVCAATLSDMHSAIVAAHRHAQGPAARRRQRAGHADAASRSGAAGGDPVGAAATR